VLDAWGNVAETIAGGRINGPWDMTALDMGTTADLFVSNVLNGTVAAGGNIVFGGTVVRLNLALSPGSMPVVQSMTTIGSGFPEKTDPAALVIGPTGVGLGLDGTLYVADSLENRIAAIPHAVDRVSTAGIGLTVSHSSTLNDPLGLAIRPGNGDIFTVNGNNGWLVETTPDGNQVFRALLDRSGTPPGAGALFGIATAPEGLYFVDDATNTLNVLAGAN
jgi:DNA-binding beta-propeller fold protein YncE